MYKKYDAHDVAKQIVSYCIASKKKFIYISGNGGSGKTELSKLICKEAQKYGSSNLIDMDDFVVDTQLRRNSKATWIDVRTEAERTGKYTTSFEASYFLQNVKSILCNLDRGNNYWHWPKKAKSNSECVIEYAADAVLTIVEGIGTVFLDKDKQCSVSIFMQCTEEIEIARRIGRARFSNEQDPTIVRQGYEERNSQFEANILPYKRFHDITFESQECFSLHVTRDDLCLLK